MASMQLQKPVDHTKNFPQHGHVPTNAQNKCNTCGYQKPVDHNKNNPQNGHALAQNKCNNTCSCCQRKENEHSFTNKVKEMANSAYKKVADQMHHHDQHSNGHRPITGPKQACHGSGGVTEGKKKEGSMTNCIPRIGDHKRREKIPKKKGNNCKCKDGSGSRSRSRSSSSDSESDNDAHMKRN
ncbi:uncharacterized protein LOC112527667 [Cynara cardunculus var. scolymus]|uniref:uncharacterized protein LOC112527667 n=1 Tax=Cynara cardunculus var. scolymus TaxID=59895 RepID=UPI000D62BC6D|nr:uncharacterized protein LOC112527667 [Cynara cardunculus var. scolymus]